jgi:protein-S-isoprenylcysteine O-methyltransferase Ste14
MIIFDPIGWFERIIPLHWLHQIIRGAALTIILAFLVVRISQYPYYFWKPLWAAETLLFIVVLIAFIVRTNPIDRSQGVKEIIIPWLGSALPFGLLKTHPTAFIMANENFLTVVFAWMSLATFFTTWGMWSLRHSFSITVEARSLVTTGPYRWVRHPVYLGEMLAATSVVVWRWSFLNASILALFVFVQMLRAHWEEAKLERVFPDYRALMTGSRWFWVV